MVTTPIIDLVTTIMIATIIIIIIIIIIIKRGWQCKAGRERLTPYQSRITFNGKNNNYHYYY